MAVELKLGAANEVDASVTLYETRLFNPWFDKQPLHKRSIVVTIVNQVQHISQNENTGPRSPFNFFVNLLAGLSAYTFREQKPSLHLHVNKALPAVAL